MQVYVIYKYIPNFAEIFATLNATFKNPSATCPLLQKSPHQVPAGALQAHQQSVVGLSATVAGFQIVLHLRQQMRGHFGVGQGPVGAA
jgi:hypothetical protein